MIENLIFQNKINNLFVNIFKFFKLLRANFLFLRTILLDSPTLLYTLNYILKCHQNRSWSCGEFLKIF